jgi:hypothetical protein
MKVKLLFLLIVFVFISGFFHVEALAREKDGKITSDACIMSYTDGFGKTLKVIRTNPLVIALR